MYGRKRNSPVLLIVDIIELVIRNPDITKNTSTPPETRLNHIWYIATSKAATNLNPSISNLNLRSISIIGSFISLLLPCVIYLIQLTCYSLNYLFNTKDNYNIEFEINYY